jgi:hypothetical protein
MAQTGELEHNSMKIRILFVNGEIRLKSVLYVLGLKLCQGLFCIYFVFKTMKFDGTLCSF